MKRLIRLPEVLARTGETKTSVYDGMDEGTFPKPVKLGPRAVAWVESEIQDWIEARIAERDGRAAA